MHAALRYLTTERRWLQLAYDNLGRELGVPGSNQPVLMQQQLQLELEIFEIGEALSCLETAFEFSAACR